MVQNGVLKAVWLKHDLHLQYDGSLVRSPGHDMLLDLAPVHLQPNAHPHAVGLRENRLHSSPEGGYAGSLLDTRTPEPVLQHWGRRDHTTLRRTAVGRMVAPVFQVACLKQVSDETQKAIIMDLFRQNV